MIVGKIATAKRNMLSRLNEKSRANGLFKVDVKYKNCGIPGYSGQEREIFGKKIQ